MSEFTTTTTEQGEQRRRRGGAFLRFGLAGVAVLGIGAAATSAAWTDQAWFAGSADAATIELQGAVDANGNGLIDEAEWIDADTDGALAVQIPQATFAKLVPGDSRDIELHLRNTGNVPLQVGLAENGLTATGEVFAGTDAATAVLDTSALTTLGGVLPADTATSVDLTVGTSPTWPLDYQSKAGTVTVTFAGSTAVGL